MTNILTLNVHNHHIRYTVYQDSLYFAFVDILEMFMKKRYNLNTTYYLKTYVPEKYCKKLFCPTIRGEKELWFVHWNGLCHLAEVFSYDITMLLEEILAQQEDATSESKVLPADEYKTLYSVSYAFAKRFPPAVAEEIFTLILTEAVDKGFVDAKMVFVGSTSIKANANRHKKVKGRNSRK